MRNKYLDAQRRGKDNKNLGVVGTPTRVERNPRTENRTVLREIKSSLRIDRSSWVVVPKSQTVIL